MTTGETIPVTNRGEIGVHPPGPEVAGVRDTTAVKGNNGPLPSGTANVSGELVVSPAGNGVFNTQILQRTFDTTPGGGYRNPEPGSPPITNRGIVGLVPPGPVVDGVADTTGADGANNHTPISTALQGTVNTLQPGQIGVGHADPVYRAPANFIPATVRDTTLTDVQPAGSLTNPIPTVQLLQGTLFTDQIGLRDHNGVLSSGTGLNQPDAPDGPDAVTGSRRVKVTWDHPDDVANDPTLGYVVEGNTTGTTFAPANATSAWVETLDPSDRPVLNPDGSEKDPGLYTFRVAARNKAGLSQFSTATDPQVRPYNPDENDPLKPGGIAPENTINPIYLPNGTVKAGTGRNDECGIGVVTPGAALSKTVTVNWTAPTGGATPTSFIIKASDGITTTTSAAGTTSKVVTFLASGAVVTFTVQAVNISGPGEVSDNSAPVTVP